MATMSVKAVPCSLVLAALVFLGMPRSSRSVTKETSSPNVDVPVKQPKVKAESAATVKAQQEQRLGAKTIVAAKRAVKSTLKDPDSAKFKGVFANYTERLGVVACGFVNAKNGFGGYAGFRRFVSAGESVILEGVDDLEGAWIDGCMDEKQRTNALTARNQAEAEEELSERDSPEADQDLKYKPSVKVQEPPDTGNKSKDKLETLTKLDIISGMKAVQPLVQDCADRYKIEGTGLATVSVSENGKVTSATATGKFAGTALGRCFEAAAKSAVFPPCIPTTFPWPFTLSPR